MNGLLIPSFIAGVLTFLAPCTLPLLPAYLGFIGGVSVADLKDPKKEHEVRRRVFLNGLLYVLGFSLVFIVLGSLFSLGGVALAQYRFWLTRIGGVFVIIFGLFLMHLLNIPWFNSEKRFHPANFLKPGRPWSSFLFGMSFAFGWTPCVGPVLGAILTLAATTTTVWQGTLLLTVFSLGLAIPFLLIALGIGSALRSIQKITKYLNIMSVIGGAFLVVIGVLLLTDHFGVLVSSLYSFFDFIHYDRLLNYL